MIPVIKRNHVQHLDLSKCGIGTGGIGSDGITAMVDVTCADTLQRMELGSNSLSLVGAMILSDGLQRCRQLMELDISSNSIGSSGMSYLAEGLKCCRQLMELDISNNSIGSSGMSYLAEGLKCCAQLL